ncbi:hypothetical protein HPB47_012290, partial [Ixodes persulcatus]
SYVWLGWAMCSFLMLGVLYAMWPANAGTGVPPVAWAAAYSAMGRTLWAVGLSWIVLASLAGYGGIVARLLSWSAMVPLSRLTYSAYIVHPLVIATFYGSQQGVLDYSEYMLAYFSMGNLCISYTAALVFSMVFEAPVMAMEKVFLGRNTLQTADSRKARGKDSGQPPNEAASFPGGLPRRRTGLSVVAEAACASEGHSPPPRRLQKTGAMTLLAVLTFLVAVAFLLSLLWVLKRRHEHSLFRRHGIPGPQPDLIFGNWDQLRVDRLQKLVAAGAIEAKGRLCLVVDPEKNEVRVKLHWIPFHLLDDNVGRAVEPYGKVTEVTRETWRVNGFKGVQSTTRIARLTLKEGVTVEQLPHQLRMPGCTALVLAPGRAPLCLRCRRTGHIRRECSVPRCDSCRRFGHTTEDCRRTYADVANVGTADETTELVMDQEEAEEAAGAPSKVPSASELPPDTAGATEPAVREPALGSPSQDQGQGQDHSRREPSPNVSGGEEAQKDDEQDMEAISGTAKRPLETAQTQKPEQTDGLQGRMTQRFQLITKRVMERWIQEYGKVFGLYMAEIPYLVVSDVDLIKQCLVKESRFFRDRSRFVLNVEPFSSSLLLSHRWADRT